MDFIKLKVTELKDELKARGLATNGLKAELLQRLQDDEASKNTSEPAAPEPKTASEPPHPISESGNDLQPPTEAQAVVPDVLKKEEPSGTNPTAGEDVSTELAGAGHPEAKQETVDPGPSAAELERAEEDAQADTSKASPAPVPNTPEDVRNKGDDDVAELGREVDGQTAEGEIGLATQDTLNPTSVTMDESMEVEKDAAGGTEGEVSTSVGINGRKSEAEDIKLDKSVDLSSKIKFAFEAESGQPKIDSVLPKESTKSDRLDKKSTTDSPVAGEKRKRHESGQIEAEEEDVVVDEDDVNEDRKVGDERKVATNGVLHGHQGRKDEDGREEKRPRVGSPSPVRSSGTPSIPPLQPATKEPALPLPVSLSHVLYPPTRSLYISNLRRPIQNGELRSHLERAGRKAGEAEDDGMDGEGEDGALDEDVAGGWWLDGVKSHSYVTVSFGVTYYANYSVLACLGILELTVFTLVPHRTTQYVSPHDALRAAVTLHASTFPRDTGGTLHIEFLPTSLVSQFVEAETEAWQKNRSKFILQINKVDSGQGHQGGDVDFKLVGPGGASGNAGSGLVGVRAGPGAAVGNGLVSGRTSSLGKVGPPPPTPYGARAGIVGIGGRPIPNVPTAGLGRGTGLAQALAGAPMPGSGRDVPPHQQQNPSRTPQQMQNRGPSPPRGPASTIPVRTVAAGFVHPSRLGLVANAFPTARPMPLMPPEHRGGPPGDHSGSRGGLGSAGRTYIQPPPKKEPARGYSMTVAHPSLEYREAPKHVRH